MEIAQAKEENILTSIDAKGSVCVTGASGYLASWLVMHLLQSGYHVKGTVRDPGNEEKTAHLWKLEGAKERLQLVEGDLLEDGSFDEAISDCRGVFHLASPVHLGAGSVDPKAEVVEPAVYGTLNVLRSCKRNPCVRRVILTSSSSALRTREDFDPSVPLDESSWSSVQLLEKRRMWYAMAKTAAEKAAWNFAEENNMDMVVILPTFIIGPSLQPILSFTALDVLGLLKGETRKFAAYGRMGYVDIDDVARCHILIYEEPTAKGRYICSSNVVEIYELGAILASRYPNLNVYTQFEKVSETVPRYTFNTSKLKTLTGFEFKGIEEMFHDCIASLKEQGHLPKQ